MEYRSKVSWKSLAGVVTGAVWMVIGVSRVIDEWHLLTPALVALLVFGFFYPATYRTEGDALTLRAGFFRRRRIPYADITRVAPSSDNVRISYALASPALMIEHKGRKALVSPEDPQTFLTDVDMRCPQLSHHGNELRAVETGAAVE